MNRLIRSKINGITQDPQIQQIVGKNVGKNTNVILCLQFNGDQAIDRACANDGEIRGALRHILSILPKPKLRNLNYLSLIITKEEMGISKAMQYLGTRNQQSFYSAADKYPLIQEGIGNVTDQNEKPENCPEKLNPAAVVCRECCKSRNTIWCLVESDKNIVDASIEHYDPKKIEPYHK